MFTNANAKKNVLKKLVEQSLNLIWVLIKQLKTLASGYNKLPEPIKNGTGNFTSNTTLLSIPNYVLQGNISGAGDATASFIINTTVEF